MNTSLTKVIWIILISVVVLSTVIALLQRRPAGSGQQTLADIRQAMREEGFKTDLADLNFITDAATRARVTTLMSFFSAPQLSSPGNQLDLLPAVSNDTATVIWKLDSFNLGTKILHWSDLHLMLDTNRWMLDAAGEAALSGPIRFDADAGKGIYMFGFQPMFLQNLSRMFALRILLELHEGDPDAAWTNLLTATRLVTAFESEPTGIAQCAQSEMTGVTFAAAWQLLQRGNWPDEKLATLQQEWESANYFTNQLESTVVDHTNDIYAIQQLARRHSMAGFSLASFIGQAVTDPANAYEEIKQIVALGPYRRRAVLADERGLMLYFQRRARELRRALQATNWAEMRALPGATNVVQYRSSYPPAEAAFKNNHSLDNGMLALVADAEARRRVLVTAIALERYRGKHSAYPATLGPLAPEFLKAVPVDFMDGQPLRYRPTEDGHFVLYSVGLDGVDDGGMVSDPSSSQWTQKLWKIAGVPTNVDIVWPRPDGSLTPTNRP